MLLCLRQFWQVLKESFREEIRFGPPYFVSTVANCRISFLHTQVDYFLLTFLCHPTHFSSRYILSEVAKLFLWVVVGWGGNFLPQIGEYISSKVCLIFRITTKIKHSIKSLLSICLSQS